MKRRDFLKTGSCGLFIPMRLGGRDKKKPDYKWLLQIEEAKRMLECEHDWTLPEEKMIEKVKGTPPNIAFLSNKYRKLECRDWCLDDKLTGGYHVLSRDIYRPLITYCNGDPRENIDSDKGEYVVISEGVDWERKCNKCGIEYQQTTYSHEVTRRNRDNTLVLNSPYFDKEYAKHIKMGFIPEQEKPEPVRSLLR
jgi:hypothetical protein